MQLPVNVSFFGNVECFNGTFGENCVGECHCRDQTKCDRDTGVCEYGSCADGWIGSNCQQSRDQTTYYNYVFMKQLWILFAVYQWPVSALSPES